MASTEASPAMGTIESQPAQGQYIKHESKVYKTIQEGLAYILVDQRDAEPAQPPPSTKNQKTTESDRPSVFYNPIQQFNRDLSVLAIRAYGEHAKSVKEKMHWKKVKGRKAHAKKANPNKRRREEDDDEGENREQTLEEDREQSQIQEQNGTSPKKACTGDGVTQAAQEAAQVPTSHASKCNTEVNTNTKIPKPWVPSFTILDALSASGLRALRYAKEIPFATRVVGNDLSTAAIESMKLNILHNGLQQVVQPNKGDACAFMYSIGRAQGSPLEPGGKPKFDVVDLDPYGTAAPFLDAAVQSVTDGGLLCVTCTDAGIFAGVGYPEKTYALYGGIPVRGAHSHEGGLRLILNAIATSAAKYGLATEPLLSLSIDFYARVFVRIHKSPTEVKFTAHKTMISFNCDHGCGSWKTQLFAEKKKQTGKDGSPFYNHKLAQGPTAAPNCEHCGFKTHLAGPMWAGPLHNPHFIQRILDLAASADKNTYQTCDRIEGMLTTALEEDLELGEDLGEPEAEATIDRRDNFLIPRVDPSLVEPYPFFFVVSGLARVLRTSTMPEDTLRGALQHLGYKSTRSHAKPNSIRTNAPWEVIWEIMREWVRQKSPVRDGALSEGTAGFGIMRRSRDKLNPVSAEGDGLTALKRDILNAVDSGRSLASLTIMLEAALYRAGIRGSRNPAKRPVSSKESQKEMAEGQKEKEESVRTSRSPSPRIEASALEVVFDDTLGKRAMETHRKKRLTRYQTNPRANWGPIARAPVSNVPKDSA